MLRPWETVALGPSHTATMIESNSVEVGSGELVPDAASGPTLVIPGTARPFTTALDCPRAVSVTLLVALALSVRILGLGASGFSEDEINKLHAVQSYGRLNFTDNAEHPMLMKLADWASLGLVNWWNDHPSLRGVVTISSEAGVRLPNALVGSATTAIVFLLAEALFDTTVGAWAALFWALDVNAAAINRIGKEDTFLVFFLLLAAYLCERGKAIAAIDVRRRDRWYTASGGAFGLMLASKYMPHYFGMHALFNVAADTHPTDNSPDRKPSFFFTMGACFLVGNLALLLPGTWRYLAGYARGDTLRHSGYYFAHRVYVNTIGATPWGLPPTFYLTFFLTKVPLVILAAALIGIVWSLRHQTNRGATFVRVFLLFTLLPYSLVSSKFLRYMLPVLAVIDIAAGLGVAVLLRELTAVRGRIGRELAAAAVAVAMIVPPLTQQIATAPFYGLAQNALGARLAPPGWWFPDDEFYDAGVREAVRAIARAAAPGAVICSDAVGVVTEYLARDHRSDIRSCSISHDGLPPLGADTWVVAQDAHMYFESAPVVEGLRRQRAPWLEISVGAVVAAQIFHLDPRPEEFVRTEIH